MLITAVKIIYKQLHFKFEAGTSRGKLKHKDTWYIQLLNHNTIIGIGEAGPLEGLSIETNTEMPDELNRVVKALTGLEVPTNMAEILVLSSQVCSKNFPSIQFAVETALLDALNGGEKIIFPTDFIQNEKRIPINGLIWMGDKEFMQLQIQQKLAAGFNCIKMKIGAIDFDTEIQLLSNIREKYSTDEITLRVDANGAFKPQEAPNKLDQLFGLGIHSIEQPIKSGQWNDMAKLCEYSTLPIALDEELIGVHHKKDKEALLKHIKPEYIILKPSLLGGIASTLEWVSIAKELNISWWMTSMLESNIGLNAICQLADYLSVKMPQGLGTGQLYHNNVDSPLTIEKGAIYYDKSKRWAEIL